MYLGMVKLGETLLIAQQCVSGNTPTNPDANPAYRIYGLVAGSIQLITNGTGTLVATDGQTGFRTSTKSIIGGDGYVAGQTYIVRVTYAISSVAKVELHTFTVV